MFLFFTLLALVIVLPYVVRAMAKPSRAPRSRPAQGGAGIQDGADISVLDFGDSGASHDASHSAGHDCGGGHGGFDGGCDAGHH
jgi:hypothetical protein